MVRVEGRVIEMRPGEVLVGNRAYPRAISPLDFPEGINLQNFVLNTWDNGTYALSASQRFNGLNHDEMVRRALGENQFLARVRDVMPMIRDVNAALRGDGVVYDALGSLIERDRLTQVGEFINKMWFYTNDRFEGGSGFKGLDLVHVTGREGNELRLEREPLEEYAVGWVELQGEMNSQGFFTENAAIGEFIQGKTIYQHPPRRGYVARFNVNSDRRADLNCVVGYPSSSYVSLGGILRVEGTPRKIRGDKE